MPMIPVRTAAGHARFVTHHQTAAAAEVAGKVLVQHPTLWRKATKQVNPATGPYWFAHYVTPDERQLKEWENRTKSNTTQPRLHTSPPQVPPRRARRLGRP